MGFGFLGCIDSRLGESGCEAACNELLGAARCGMSASAAMRKAKQRSGKSARQEFDAANHEHYRYRSEHRSPLVADEASRAQLDR
eukprot:COSAG02_NODE_49398_length_327_cov_0.675439_1_plen_85_part_00